MSKHYHLIGIGGIGMGTLASLLLDQGHNVSGSDLKDNEIDRGLTKKGALYIYGPSYQQCCQECRLSWFIHLPSV